MVRKASKSIWRQINNLALIILSGGFFWIGASFLEYEISKLQKTAMIWIQTPKILVFSVSLVIILGTILTFAFLVLIYKKGLENRRWLWGIIFLQAVGLIILSAVLGYQRFIWILFPSTFSIFK